MKSFFRTSIVMVVGVLFLGSFAACSQDSTSAVKSYNNSIVEIQKNMLANAQTASQVFNQSHLDTQKIVTTLQGIQSNIQTSHTQFKALSVPHGAEPLATSMEKFFQVEINGIQNVIAGVQQLQGNENNASALQNFTNSFNQFSSDENDALRDFYLTQQQVAGQYSQQVVQTDN